MQLGITIALAILLSPTVWAQEGIPYELEGERMATPTEIQREVESAFERSDSNGIEQESSLFTFRDGGSHLRIRYSSANPVPVLYGPFDGRATFDPLLTILPPSEEGDVLIPLLASPWWNPREYAFVVRTYNLKSANPTMHKVTLESVASAGERIGAYASHLAADERFIGTSINELSGYSIGGFSFTILLGTALLLITGIWLALGLPKRLLPTIALVFILVYAARFSLNIVRSAAADVSAWRTDGTYADAIDMYPLIQKLKLELVISSRPESVAVCGTFATPLRYFLYPTEIKTMGDGWDDATLVALFAPWSAEGGLVTCDGKSRPGEIIATFPAGSAIARLHSLP
ncbi:MAG: hypothetical protein Q7R81_01230 [Candidatus Peregrinibacteria bacterium]|nr:hypothetical protein [Candidatus Peregrinibacteria bacterium]